MLVSGAALLVIITALLARKTFRLHNRYARGAGPKKSLRLESTADLDLQPIRLVKTATALQQQRQKLDFIDFIMDPAQLVAALEPPQLAVLEQMRDTFKSEDGYGMQLDDACYLRYLRARSYNYDKSSKMLKATIAWRQEFGVQKILQDEMDIVANENATGKVYLRGTDKSGKLIMIMRPKNENTNMMDNQLKHVVYNMERSRRILQVGGT